MKNFEELIRELDELYANATPGEWRFSPWHAEEGPSAVRAQAGWIIASTASDSESQLIAALHNAYPALRDALERMQWIPVSERLPEEGTSVLAWYEEWIDPVVVHYNAESGWIEDGEEMGMAPTHWQPLPEPPAAIDHDQPIGSGDA